MSLPISPMQRPALLSGMTNGRLPSKVLLSTPGIGHTPAVLLVEPAARAWRALVFNADIAGHKLAIGWKNSAYRPYEDQERIFLQRYTTTPNTVGGSRIWRGQRWFKRPGVAAAAVPGTSNHGWGLAVDVGEETPNGVHSLDAQTLEWMKANVHRYGWSWELQSEPWHIRYVAGDDIPLPVLRHEAIKNNDREDDEGMQVLIDTTTREHWVTDNGKARFLSNPADWMNSWQGPIRKSDNMRHVIDDLYDVVT